MDISPNPSKLFIYKDLVGFGSKTGFTTKYKEFSGPQNLYENTNYDLQHRGPPVLTLLYGGGGYPSTDTLF
jgi:hypothetical protein